MAAPLSGLGQQTSGRRSRLEFWAISDKELEVDPGLLLDILRQCWFSPTAAEPEMFFFLPLHDKQNTGERKVAKHLISIFTASEYDSVWNRLNPEASVNKRPPPEGTAMGK